MKIKIVIVGAGIAGRALYRFLELKGGFDIEIYDIENKPRCGIHPCAWGVNTTDFIKIHYCLDLPVETIINKYKKLNFDGDVINCDLCTIDKPKFLEQMCSGHIKTDFDITRYKNDSTLIIDATGEKRALLPEIKDDMKISCKQALYHSDQQVLPISIYHSSEVGYAWSFPIDNGLTHIGQGNMDWTEYDKITAERSKKGIEHYTTETRKAMFDAGLFYGGVASKPLCKDESKIRLLSPKYSQPFVANKNHICIVGVGESIGCVQPGSGAGILPSIECAGILADHLNGSYFRKDIYTRSVLDHFSYLDRETTIIQKLIAKKPLNILDFICLKRNNRKFGIYPGLRQTIKSLKKTGARFW